MDQRERRISDTTGYRTVLTRSLTGDTHLFFKDLADLLCIFFEFFGIRQANDQEEFLTAVTNYDTLSFRDLAKRLSDQCQDHVSILMTEFVIDPLEVINIDHKDSVFVRTIRLQFTRLLDITQHLRFQNACQHL